MTTDKAGDELGCRPAENLLWATLLLDTPAIHDHDQLGERHGLVLAVRDMHEGDGKLLLQPLQYAADFGTKNGSSADSGSSSKRICGSVINARARATRCCCPPESCEGKRAA